MALESNSALGEINRKYWNEKIETLLSQEWVIALGHQIAKYLQKEVKWIGVKPSKPGAPIRLLDYACGTGLASRALSPFVSITRGIDVSDIMVAKFNESSRAEGFSDQQMQAFQGDLLAPAERIPASLAGPDMHEFDVAVMSMALHHVEQPLKMLKQLVQRLRVGGSILIIDWVTEAEKESTGLHHGHHHGGSGDEHEEVEKVMEIMRQASFDKSEMIEMLRDAGCDEVDFELHPEVSVLPEKFGGEKRLFFARGKKSG